MMKEEVSTDDIELRICASLNEPHPDSSCRMMINKINEDIVNDWAKGTWFLFQEIR